MFQLLRKSISDYDLMTKLIQGWEQKGVQYAGGFSCPADTPVSESTSTADSDARDVGGGIGVVNMPRHPLSARFHELVKEISDLHDKKQADYGRENDPFANVRGSREWGIDDWVGAMIRLNDKVKRLQVYAQRGSLANEGVEDSFKDIAVYAIIALCLWEEGRSTKVEQYAPLEPRTGPQAAPVASRPNLHPWIERDA